MNNQLFQRVKNSLQNEHYSMNDSWLSECVEFYINDHENATQKEIITFVINQWLLSDLREINNDHGCLPRNLANQRVTTLPAKYILQMDKVYDISQSKYKQLEKIRQVSTENVDATENENAIQEDKFSAWEPKPKRMLQLFLTDGLQDVLAIEYKPIRFLKDNLYPGYKVLIKGPVICRKGVILLEENNITEIGGEVESLLIVNAVENVFARALNLEENPDPYNDNNAQSTQSTQKNIQLDDDFDIDTQALDQIEKEIQQTYSEDKKSNNTVNKSKQTTSTASTSSKKSKTDSLSYSYSYPNVPIEIDDSDDKLLEMVDEKQFQDFSNIKTPSISSHKVDKKKQSSSNIIENQCDDFPTEEEMQDLSEMKFPHSYNSKQSTELSSKVVNSSTTQTTHRQTSNQNKLNLGKLNEKCSSWKLPSPLPSVSNVKKNLNIVDEYSADDFDFDMKIDDFRTPDDIQSCQASTNRKKPISAKSKYKNEYSSHIEENLAMDFENEFDTEFESKLEIKPETKHSKSDPSFLGKVSSNTSSKSSKFTDLSSNYEVTGIKRLASTISPSTIGAPSKMRCLQSTPKSNSFSRNIAEYFNDKTVLDEILPKQFEYIKEVLKKPLTSEPCRTVVRGKVINIVKLNLNNDENGYYFHLDATISDTTSTLDIVFSSKVLEEIIGYDPQEFRQKRRQGKTNPSIKDQLREDLQKAQQKLRLMDEFMELELKLDQKPKVLKTLKLTKEQKKQYDEMLKLHNSDSPTMEDIFKIIKPKLFSDDKCIQEFNSPDTTDGVTV
ncbi:recQ-mediated genome instability protein 1-like [Trichogramma pretiosum]|uniref:recQ-mediated genome instability protein 1-like n=1 Tax=Trichogramma pretiosum TaxID=7493 RepID=UPI0006C9A7DD|nr:recQ-mediated genome instability protein 1-like [Trichogramma pretiosum]